MPRHNHLDALRSAAMLIVVVWHVTILWPLFVPLSPSTEAAIRWPLAMSRWSLPLFFLMAGFFGALLLERWGVAAFVKDRLLRIGLPLAVALVTIVPLARLTLSETLPSLERAGFLAGPMHLWFLWYALLFYALSLAVRRIKLPGGTRNGLRDRLASPLAPLALAGLTALLVAAGRELPASTGSWIVPNPCFLLFYGSFFVVGQLLHGSRRGIAELGKRPWLHATIALAVLVPAVLLAQGPGLWSGPIPLERSLHAYGWLLAFCVLAWSATFAVCGFGQRWLSAPHPAIRYIADSSYWLYLAHLPLLPLVILLIVPLALPFAVAWALALTVLFSTLLVSYELLVRHSVIGRVLNGPRPPRRWGVRNLRPSAQSP